LEADGSPITSLGGGFIMPEIPRLVLEVGVAVLFLIVELTYAATVAAIVTWVVRR
jgi:hypothetical protein